MTDKKKAPPLKQAAATQRMSKDELAELLKRAEAEDPDAEANVEAPDAEAAKNKAPKKG